MVCKSLYEKNDKKYVFKILSMCCVLRRMPGRTERNYKIQHYTFKEQTVIALFFRYVRVFLWQQNDDCAFAWHERLVRDLRVSGGEYALNNFNDGYLQDARSDSHFVER